VSVLDADGKESRTVRVPSVLKAVLLASRARLVVFRHAHMKVGLISSRGVQINLECCADWSRHLVSGLRRSSWAKKCLEEKSNYYSLTVDLEGRKLS
jgi:hypothetical protein